MLQTTPNGHSVHLTDSHSFLSPSSANASPAQTMDCKLSNKHPQFLSQNGRFLDPHPRPQYPPKHAPDDGADHRCGSGKPGSTFLGTTFLACTCLSPAPAPWAPPWHKLSMQSCSVEFVCLLQGVQEIANSYVDQQQETKGRGDEIARGERRLEKR